MSDHPKEAKRNLKRIRICNDIYFDVFRLLSPKKVGSEVAVVSDRFDALVDTQFEHYRKWTLGKLEIQSDQIVKLNDDETEEILPFPQMPLPNSVVGFASVVLCSFSADAIAFVHSTARLFQSNIFLKFNFLGATNCDAFATSVLPLLNLSAITKMHIRFASDFRLLRRIISPSILCNFANLRIVTLHQQCFQFPPDDSDGSYDGQAFCRWLHTPRADGQPKVLKGYSFGGLPMDELKTHFLKATTSANFIIVCIRSFYIASFELVNSSTCEQMKCRRIDDCFTIVRCPIDKNEKQWAEWEKEAVENRSGNDWKTIEICAS